MHRIVISDTSCLVVLDKIKKIFLLKELYSEVITTPEIVAEFGLPLPEWITIKRVTDKTLQNQLEEKIDLGEASALALAKDIPDCILILDDLKARKIATDLHLDYTGTLGILVKAKQKSLLLQVGPLVTQLKEVGLRFSEEVEKDILRQTGEL
jgi:predicted nucleic acid-binding protein